MREPLAQVRLDLAVQVLRAHDHAGVGVGDVVRELVAAVHRVDRHHHRVGAQDGVVADDELRAVLRVEQHAVAAAHAADVLQVAGERLGRAQQLGIGERRAVVVDRALVRIAARAHFEVVIQAGARHRQRFRHSRRPVGVVAREHQSWKRFTAFSSQRMPMPGRSGISTWPSFSRAGSSSTASAQSTYSSQWQVGVTARR